MPHTSLFQGFDDNKKQILTKASMPNKTPRRPTDRSAGGAFLLDRSVHFL